MKTLITIQRATLIAAIALGAACVKLDIRTEVPGAQAETKAETAKAEAGKAEAGKAQTGKVGIMKVTASDPNSVPNTLLEDLAMKADDGGGPGGNGDMLPLSVTSFLGNTAQTGCFTAANGWDKYYPLPKLLLGPNTTPSSITYTNEGNLASVTLTTLNIGNAATLDTAIVIYPEFNPLDRSCLDLPGAGEALTRIPTANGTRYKAGIFYKSSTLPQGTTTVFLRWQYP